ncbi:glycoside hydrolase family 65 protein [Corynebacterium glyciniphilum]|uniref:glycoside hydrolase family 65 protein n=1 Tax=Corynebacterium glyciniphilum TaxID=1404244 RepID=UPI003DA00057
MSGNDATDGSGTNGSRQTALENFLDQRRRVASVVNRPIDTADMANATEVAGVADTVGGADEERLFPTGYRADQHHHDTDPMEGIDRENNPVDEWGWYEKRPERTSLGLTESHFALSNGYLGVRGTPPEGRDSEAHGTFINGVHETWPISHAEDAYGLAREGQAIVQVPDAKTVRIYVDDEPLRLSQSEIEDYSRGIDFRDGVLRRSFVWRTPSGKRVRITNERMVSFNERHLMVTSTEIELLDAPAAVVVSSQILNRQDGEDEYSTVIDHTGTTADGPAGVNDGADPRKAEQFKGRVFIPTYQAQPEDERVTLGYRINHSGMTVAVSMDHELELTGTDEDGDHAVDGVEVHTELREDVARVVYHMAGRTGMKLRLEKFISYHSSRHVAADELAFRCARTINRAKAIGFRTLQQHQKNWLAEFWDRSDVRIPNHPELQQAVRWNIFQLIQASARAETQGVPAKGLTGSGYGGHYFWDTEIYVMPFLTYTNPQFARNAMRFRYKMLPAARERALELSHDGVLFPWRTINGHESSAYYAAGTAQYHIDADISYALMKYIYASGDTDFLLDEGIHILVGTARFFMSLGFFNSSGTRFEIHSVTGPDEYTTVVNNNLYTNVMAQYNLRVAAEVVRQMKSDRPGAYRDMMRRTGLSEDELDLWDQAADAMYIPFNESTRVNPQDDQFMQRQLWSLDDPEVGPKRPLLLHYHPLTIYRYQILKQADVVLAVFLQGSQFDAETKRRDYNYYDRLTTGDSSLSAVVQSIMAAELGMHDKALDFFHRGLFIDLNNLHGNTADGVHIASCGGVWSCLVYGFGGFRDHYGQFTIDPRVPEEWGGLEYSITLHGRIVRVSVADGEVTLCTADDDPEVVGPVTVCGEETMVGPEPVTVSGKTLLRAE